MSVAEGSYPVSRLSGQQPSVADIGRLTSSSEFRAARTHRPGNPACDLPPSSTSSSLPVLGDGEPLQVPLNSVVSIGAGVTVSVKDSDGKMVATISDARPFEAQMKMLQTVEAKEKAAAQLLTAN